MNIIFIPLIIKIQYKDHKMTQKRMMNNLFVAVWSGLLLELASWNKQPYIL